MHRDFAQQFQRTVERLAREQQEKEYRYVRESAPAEKQDEGADVRVPGSRSAAAIWDGSALLGVIRSQTACEPDRMRLGYPVA